MAFLDFDTDQFNLGGGGSSPAITSEPEAVEFGSVFGNILGNASDIGGQVLGLKLSRWLFDEEAALANSYNQASNNQANNQVPAEAGSTSSLGATKILKYSLIGGGVLIAAIFAMKAFK